MISSASALPLPLAFGQPLALPLALPLPLPLALPLAFGQPSALPLPPFSPICSVCAMPDLVLPCLTCHRPQCETCFFALPNKKECEGCRLERILEMGEEEEEMEEEEEEEPGVLPPSPPSPPSPPLSALLDPVSSWGVGEVVEPGIFLSRPLWYPSEEEWRMTQQILESHILFTSSSAGPLPPVPYMKYLVGRVYDPYTRLTTEYLMSYEPIQSQSQPDSHWKRYMVTYYMFSPMPWERDLFAPYPLPLPLPLR